MTALQRAVDLEAMRDVLAAAAGVEPRQDTGSWTVEVARHKPRKRWTLRYCFEPTSSRTPEAASLIGKLYVRRERAGALVDRMQALRTSMRGPVGVHIPAPLAALPELGLALQAPAKGSELREELLAGAASDAIRLAGQWLAALHGTPPLPGLRVKTMAHELRKVSGWIEQIAPALPKREARRLVRAEHELRGIADGMPPTARAMIHRDFYYGNLFWDGDSLWVLDFDDLSVGDPVLDVGHFLVHLEKLGYLSSGRTELLAEPALQFVETYAEHAPLDAAVRLPFFRGYTLVKLAATEVQRQVGDWRRTALLFSTLAQREIERAA
jgi:aminoglycoside phosphotransferase (APT) family kinase protein